MALLNKMYSDKQEEVLRFAFSAPWNILINHGAVRSGKTVIDNDIFLTELTKARERAYRDGRDAHYILTGDSLGAIRRNVIAELESKYGFEIKLDNVNSFHLNGVRVFCFGHSKADSYKAIVGMTAYGAYLNEATTAHETAFDEILKRCSGRYRILMDTNPDHPKHFLKTNYIDKADQRKLAQFHWDLDDNPFLDEDYIEGIKAQTPSGVFFNRKIKGIWCVPEGLVFQDFDPEKHYVEDLSRFNFVRHYAGVDWGYGKGHPGVIGVFGEERNGTTVLLEETAEEGQEIDFWKTIARQYKTKYGNIPFFCDSARPEHIDALLKCGIRAINADKEVLSGLEEVGKRIKTGRFYVYRPGQRLFEDEVQTYSWDERTGMPKKVNDNSMDMTRYALYTSKNRPYYR